MPRFQFPQFIETKTKVIGPLTFMQFIYLAIGGALIFLLRFVMPVWLLIISAIIIGVLACAFAFLKIDDRSLSFYVGNAIGYIFKTKKYTYQDPDSAVYEELAYSHLQKNDK